MTNVLPLKRKKSRKRMLPFFAAGIVGLHVFVFFLLAQCGRSEQGTTLHNEQTYIRVHTEHRSETSLTFTEPPKQLFYRYANAPLLVEQTEPLPLEEPYWDGYQTVAYLREETFSPMENYRLTIRQEKEERRRSSSPVPFLPTVNPVIIAGVPMQPVTRVPEPSTSLFVLSSLFLVLCRRCRK